MLAELAAANAAFAVIKTAVQNGGDLAKVAHKIADFTNAETEIERKVRDDKSRHTNYKDLEAFYALEDIEAMKTQLKEAMIWGGNPGEWDRWVKFQAEARIRRQEEQKEREARATEMFNTIGYGAIVVAAILGLYGLFLFVIYLKGL